MKKYFLDTNIIIWLYEKKLDRFSQNTLQILENTFHDLICSYTSLLELQYLFEIGEITISPYKVFSDLQIEIGLHFSVISFEKIISASMNFLWTRDPFDRMIVANAQCEQAPLITSNRNIREHYNTVIWD